MAAPQKPDGARTPGREEEARRDLGNTRITRPLALFLTLFFLALIYGVPATQIGLELADEERAGLPTPLDVGRIAQAAAGGWKEGEAPLDRLLQANAATLRAIDLYEEEVEDRSFLTRQLLGPVQLALTGVFGLGNEEAYIGKDDWLFFRADVDHLTGPGFLSDKWLKMRRQAGNEYSRPQQPDPREAILQFRDQLAGRGIRLVLLPTPVKPSLRGDALVLSPEAAEIPIRNESFQTFMQEMEAAGVTVLDAAEALERYRRETGRPAYLKTDTHWTFDAMRSVARSLTAFLSGEAVGTEAESDLTAEVENLGDIAGMLRLPAGQTLLRPERQTITQPKAREPSGPGILLLGDSFTNIYSMRRLGWGEDAGLAEQLQAATGRPVTKIAINAGGAHAARTELISRLRRGRPVLDGVDTVIWQFATRELSQGDWRLMDLPASSASPREPGPEDAGEAPTPQGVEIRAVIAERTDAPAPGSVPYPDCLVSLHLKNVESPEGANLPDEILVYTWGLRDGELVNQSLEPGQAVRLSVAPWSLFEDEYGSLNRKELFSEAAFLLDQYWGMEWR